MAAKTLTLNQALFEIKSGNRFDIEYVTCDRQRNTGGTIKVLTNCIYPKKQKAGPSGDIPKEDTARAPRHFQNSTINIQQLGNKEIRKVHIRLITKLNGIAVV